MHAAFGLSVRPSTLTQYDVNVPVRVRYRGRLVGTARVRRSCSSSLRTVGYGVLLAT